MAYQKTSTILAKLIREALITNIDSFPKKTKQDILDGLNKFSYAITNYILNYGEPDTQNADTAKRVTNGNFHAHTGGAGAQIAHANLSGVATTGAGAIHGRDGGVLGWDALYNESTSGSWSVYMDGAVLWNSHSVYNSNHNLNEWISYKVYIPEGTYTLTMVGHTANNRGICSVYVDDVQQPAGAPITVDWYDNPGSANVKKTISITTTSPGAHILKFKVTGKNVASSDHYLSFQYFFIV